MRQQVQPASQPPPSPVALSAAQPQPFCIILHPPLRSQVLAPPHGVVLIAAKSFYFGVGGGVAGFQRLVEADGTLQCERVGAGGVLVGVDVVAVVVVMVRAARQWIARSASSGAPGVPTLHPATTANAALPLQVWVVEDGSSNKREILRLSFPGSIAPFFL